MDERSRQATRLWTSAQPAVSAFLTSAVRDFSVRQDLLQDVAVAVIESFDRYDPSRPFVAWAIGIAQNHVKTYLRRVRRDRHVFDDDTVAALAVTFASPDVSAAEPLEHLKDCLEKLPPSSRKLCDLRYVDDLKPAAIAEINGMTANSVAKALQRIREQLRDCLELRQTLHGGAK
jgi:RNA polymerase sigma-70 factor (ECF subfamily)